jgi:phosphomevalonate kinase
MPMVDDRAVAPGESRAPGKLVLLGEYAVLEGAPALVAAVDREVTARELPPTGGAPVLVALGADRQILALDRSRGVWRTAEPGWTLAVQAIEAAFGANAPSLEVDSRAFFLSAPDGSAVKAGFGSSAAVVTAILTLGHAANKLNDHSAIFHRAREVHHAAQGNIGSGVDIAAAVYGGIVNYRLVNGAPVCLPHVLPADLVLLAVWTGAPASTTDLVARVVKWKASAPEKHVALFARMARCAAEGIGAATTDAAGFLAAMKAYGALMDELGINAEAPIVTPAMRSLAEGLGPLAAVKPSGAGGGDIVLVGALRDDEVAVRRRLDQLGAVVIPLHFGAPGASLIAGTAGT